MLLLAIKPLSPAIRRRAGVLLLPVFVTIAPVSWILIAVIDFNLFPGTSPTATEWGALAVVPVLSFAVGLIWIARYERKLRITA
jgi:hypothetical protein